MIRLVLISFLIFLYSCNNKSNRQDKSSTKEQSKDIKENSNEQSNTNEIRCDSTLWKHVYDASRLKIIESCKVVTGIIEESNADEDGDTHMLLKLDQGQESLLNNRNMKKKKGNLVVEVICANKIKKKIAKVPCEGYINNINLPQVGDHVKITGSYVIDTHNGWFEIHPVTKIEMIK